MRCVRQRVLSALTGAGILLGSGLAPGVVRAVAATGPGWSQLPVPSPQAPQAGLDAVSCPSAVACVAVGDYYNANGAQVTLAEAWHEGIWSVQPTRNPPGTGADVLLAVSCASSNSCMAVGFTRRDGSKYRQHALTEAWNGKSWTVEPSPRPVHMLNVALSGVSCVSPSACMAVGYGEHGNGEAPLAQTWDGQQWTIVKAPLPAGSTSAMFSGVSCTAAAACTAVGRQPAGNTTLAEVWNGSAWAVQPTPSPSGSGGPSVLSSVSCLPGGTACTAVGYRWSNGQDVTLAEVRQGTRWKVQPTPTPKGQDGITQGVLTGVSCGSAAACSAVGDHIDHSGHQVTLAELWNGTAWKIVPAPAAGKVSTLSGVSCPAASRCTAVGVDYPSYQFTPPGAADSDSLAGAWNGTSWAIEAAPSPAGLIFNSLAAISCGSRTACASVGYQQGAGGNAAFAEIWNGTRWAIAPVPAPAAADDSKLTGVSCASATSCVAVGAYQTTSADGLPMAEVWNGSRWTLTTMLTRPGATDTQLSGISCTSAAHCAAVGSDDAAGNGETLVEVWNGRGWRIQPSPNPPGATEGAGLNAVACASATSCSAVGSYLNGGPVLAFAEYWNGSSWTVQSTPEASGTDTYLEGVSCPSPGTCTAVGSTGGSGTLAETLQDGTWGVASSPSPGSGAAFLGVSCTSATACSAVGNYGTASAGVPLAERWNGHSWTVQPAPIGATGGYQVDYLTGVSCVAASWCMASGSNQTYHVPATGSLSSVAERYS